MKDLTNPEEQLIEEEHDRRGGEEIEQGRAVLRELPMNVVRRDGRERRHPDDDQADQNEHALNEVRPDDGPEPPEHRVSGAHHDDRHHPHAVIDPRQRLEEYAAGHPHAHQPSQGVEERDAEEHDPARASEAGADEVAARISLRHELLDAGREGSESDQSDRGEGVAEHAPHAELVRELRRRHGGVGRHPGGHRGRGPEGEADAPPGHRPILVTLGVPSPPPAEGEPEHAEGREDDQAQLPADDRIAHGRVFRWPTAINEIVAPKTNAPIEKKSAAVPSDGGETSTVQAAEPSPPESVSS